MESLLKTEFKKIDDILIRTFTQLIRKLLTPVR